MVAMPRGFRSATFLHVGAVFPAAPPDTNAKEPHRPPTSSTARTFQPGPSRFRWSAGSVRTVAREYAHPHHVYRDPRTRITAELTLHRKKNSSSWILIKRRKKRENSGKTRKNATFFAFSLERPLRHAILFVPKLYRNFICSEKHTESERKHSCLKRLSASPL